MGSKVEPAAAEPSARGPAFAGNFTLGLFPVARDVADAFEFGFPGAFAPALAVAVAVLLSTFMRGVML